MRFFQLVWLLIAVLPLALAGYSPPPFVPSTCSVGSYRCNNNALQRCGQNGQWKTTKDCTKTAYCFAQANVKGGGDCYPLLSSDKQCSVANVSRCNGNTLEACQAHGYWKTTKECSKTAYCFAQANMADGSGDCHPLIIDLKQCSIANTHRCYNNNSTSTSTLQVCSDRGYWKKVKDCGKSEQCTLDGKSEDGGICTPVVPHDTQGTCKPNTRRCKINNIEECTADKQWVTRADCTTTNNPATASVCNEACTPDGCQASCVKFTDFFLPYLCTPGIRICAADASAVLVCTESRYYVAETLCGDTQKCTKYSEGKIHCMAPHGTKPLQPTRSGYALPHTISSVALPSTNSTVAVPHTNSTTTLSHTKSTIGRPPKHSTVSLPSKHSTVALPHTNFTITLPSKSTYALPPHKLGHELKRHDPAKQCNSGDLACDKERRFLFKCNKDGMWSTEPKQCFGPGYCRPDNLYPLTCAGFPRYGGDDSTCNMHCETMDYLYCIGSLWSNPERVKKCHDNMCAMKDCIACDRCHYEQPYGGVEPDLTTLVPAKL